MKIVADTTVLLRDVLQDDPRQAKLAARALRSAELIAVPISVLCEFSWVLRQGSGKTAEEVATAIRYLINSESVSPIALRLRLGWNSWMREATLPMARLRTRAIGSAP